MARTAVLVDDTGFMRTHLRSIIENYEYEVVGEGSDGNEAVALYKRYKPDLMTMDIVMPNKNGIDAVREILDFDQEAKVIMVSAMGQKAKVLDAIDAGAKDFIVKPFNRERIEEALSKL